VKPNRAHVATLLGAATIAVAGCGGGGSSTTADIPAGPAPTTPATPAVQASKDLKDTSKKPEIPKPKGAPPKTLQVKDIVKGKGRAAKSGDNLTMQYVGVSYSTGAEFDASWDKGQPFKFQLGKGMVIKGWDKGLVGIKPGGRRELIIPPKLGYGAQGQPPSIGPNETLVFIVDALKVSGK
jgi:peptidylprolyl isomerase